MPNEKSLNEMTVAELRAGINEYLSGSRTRESVPLPPAANRAALTPEQQETAFENWVQYIYSRPTQTWTPDEVAAIRAAAMRALRTL